MNIYLLILKHLIVQLAKLQIDILNLNTSFPITFEQGYTVRHPSYTLGKKGCYTPGWFVSFVIISISSVCEV